MNSIDQLDQQPLKLSTFLESIRESNPIFIAPLEAILSFNHFKFLNPDGIKAIIYLIQESIKANDTERIYNLLFNPQLPTEDDIYLFRDWHEFKHIEIAHILAQNLFKTPGSSLLLESGMYGGKTTLAHIVCTMLEGFRYKVFVIVPKIINEDRITIRGSQGKQGKGNQEVEAIQIDEDNWEKVIKDIEQDMAVSNPRDPTRAIIQFDEYSFLPAELVEKIAKKLCSYGFRLIFAGLNTDYLGRSLPGYLAAKNFIDNSVQGESYFCKSFTYHQALSENISPYPDPNGEMTLRYIKVNDQWILDLGFGKLVIRKGMKFVLYIPGKLSDHTQSLLANNPSLLNSILSPRDKRVIFQKRLVKLLEEESAEKES